MIDTRGFPEAKPAAVKSHVVLLAHRLSGPRQLAIDSDPTGPNPGLDLPARAKAAARQYLLDPVTHRRD
ncbi:MAG: hypothetical protein WBO00_10080 [Steroidobacteraceae bacterium]